MPAPTPPSGPIYPLPSVQPVTQKTVNVIWLDVNTNLGNNGKTDLLPDVQAINNSLYNLIRCPIGARGPIGQPEYGTLIYYYLQEPCDYITANKIRITFIQAIQRWEPRIQLDMARTQIIPDFDNGTYWVQIYYQILSTKNLGQATYKIGN